MRSSRSGVEELERRLLLYHELPPCYDTPAEGGGPMPVCYWPEICDDGIDNDYDHLIDEDCAGPPTPEPEPLEWPTVEIEATDPLGEEEGPDSAWFTIYVFDSNGSPGFDSELVVEYSVSGTASDADYTALNSDGTTGLTGSLTIPAHQPFGTIQIVPVDDRLIEPDETVTLTLSTSPNYEIELWHDQATAVIVDNDFDLEGGPCKEADFQSTLELTAGAADEIVSVDALCGNVHFDFATWAGYGRGFDGSAFLPEWRSNEDARPIVTVDVQLPDPKPDRIVVNSTIGKTPTIVGPEIVYTTDGFDPGEWARIAVQFDATSLETGHYDYRIVLTSEFADGATSMQAVDSATEVINRSASPFGDNWWLEGLERLVMDRAADGSLRGATLVRSDGTAAYFEWDSVSGTLVAPAHLLTTLEVSATGGGYTLKNRWGDQWLFDGDGLMLVVRDRHGVGMTYSYIDADADGAAEELSQMRDHYGRTATYVYTAGKLSKVVDHVGRETLFERNWSGQIGSITLPDPDPADTESAPRTTFGYDWDGQLHYILDAAGQSAWIGYSFARRFGGVTRPDASSWHLRPVQLVGLANTAAGEGTYSWPATPGHADDVKAIYTNPRGYVTTIEVDRFGYATRIADPLGQATLYRRESHSLITRISEPDPDGAGPLGRPVTTISYNGSGNPTGVTQPDGQQILFAYGQQGLVTQIIGPGLDSTFSYDVAGRLTLTRDELRDDELQFHLGNVVRSSDGRDIDTLFAYDTLGRLITVTDELGEQTTYEYDTADNLTATTDRTFVRTEYSYDRLDRLGMVTYPQSVASGPLVRYAYSYDAVGNLTRELSPRNGVTVYQYDGLRRLTQVTDAVGGVTRWAYDPAGNVASTTDSVYRTTMYTYDPLDRANEVRRFPNFWTRYAYDAAGRVAQLTDARGNATAYEYDIMGNLIAVLDAANHESTFQYNAAGWLTKAFDALQRETRYSHDAAGRVTAIERPPYNFTTTFAYDPAGNLTRVDRPGGRHTSFVYDQLNRLERQLDANGNPDTYLYDAEGRLLAHTDAVGRTSSVLYDALGRVRREQDVLGYEQVYTRDADGNVIKVEGRDTWQLTWVASYDTLAEYEYDLIGRMTKATRYVDPADLAIRYVAEYEYDGVHRITRHEDAAGRVQSCQYDFWVGGATPEEYKVRSECRLNTRQPWRRTYDGVGNLVSVTDPLGYSTRYEYDDLNQLTKIIDARLGETRFAYDAVGNLVNLTDPVGNSTTYQYDGLDRVTRETNQLGLSRQYAYDAAGNLDWLTDRNGRVRKFQYDLLNRLVREAWPTDGVGSENAFGYSYDAVGRLTAAIDNDSRYSYTYTSPRSVTIELDAMLVGSPKPDMPHVVLNEAYDARGRRTALEATVDGARDFSNTYEYDLLGRMTQVQQYGVAGGHAVGEKRVDFRYNAIGQFTMIQRFRDLAGGQMAAYSQFGYDAYGNLRAIEHRYPAGAMISQYSYTHDDLDRITSVVDPAGTTNYSYDETSQLVSADYSPLPTNPSPLPDESYSYDLNGNRTNTGYVTAADNRLQQAVIDGATFEFQYDYEGNLVTRKNLGTGEVTTYAWDRRNRLVRVAELIPNAADSPAIKEVTFTYDAFDRRIAKTVDPDGTGPQVAHSELFVYDGIHIALVFEDLDSSGPQASSLQSRHLFGPAVDMVLAEERPTNPQSPTSSPAKTYWLLADHLGSIRDIISPDCDGGGHIDYTAFGRVAAVFDYLGAAATLDAIVAKRFLFTGREWDAEPDLYYYRARYYDAAIARFVGQDPISFAGGDANLYRYVANAPIEHRDPSGLVQEEKEKERKQREEDEKRLSKLLEDLRKIDSDLATKYENHVRNGRPRIRFGALPPLINGSTNPETSHITISRDISDREFYPTLAHELYHISHSAGARRAIRLARANLIAENAFVLEMMRVELNAHRYELEYRLRRNPSYKPQFDYAKMNVYDFWKSDMGEAYDRLYRQMYEDLTPKQ